MAPKVKAKAKPKAKAAGKAKAAAKARGRRQGRLRAGAHIPARRRPAAAAAGGPPLRGDPLDEWRAGSVVKLLDLPLEELLTTDGIVFEEATYFKKECRVAGTVTGTLTSGDGMFLRLNASGTTNEALLRMQSGNPTLRFRVHRCPLGCNGELVADDIIHAKTVRLMKPIDSEEGWVRNLEKAAVAQEDDELAELRRRANEGVALGIGGAAAAKAADPKAEKEKEDEKTKKKKKSKKEKKKSKSESASGAEEVTLDGRRPRAASVKTLASLYAGTGMDPKERVRLRVARRAKKIGSKKEAKKSSSSSTSSSESLGLTGDVEDTIFVQATKVRKIAETCPGVLGSQALGQMKAALLTEVGVDHTKGAPAPVAMQYFRQVLSKRATGPVAREMITLASSIDSLAKGRPSAALDTLVQRLKSTESALGGVHWSIAQRLELVPAETPALAAATEIREAQRDASNENKTKYLAGFPEGRSNLGRSFGKGKSKDEGKKGDQKKGKGAGKGDGKRKDDATK